MQKSSQRCPYYLNLIMRTRAERFSASSQSGERRAKDNLRKGSTFRVRNRHNKPLQRRILPWRGKWDGGHSGKLRSPALESRLSADKSLLPTVNSLD